VFNVWVNLDNWVILARLLIEFVGVHLNSRRLEADARECFHLVFKLKIKTYLFMDSNKWKEASSLKDFKIE
jgi:hypothetical protein